MAKRAIIVSNNPKGIWPFTLTNILYEPVAVALLAGAAYAMGIALDARWASVPLAATIVTVAVLPASEEAEFAQSLTGNIAAMLVAFVTIRTFGLEHGNGVDLLSNFGPLRALGVLVAMIATPLICTFMRIIQPSAAATAAFIVFCGVTPSPHSALSLAVEILLIASLGDIMRRWRIKGTPR